MPIIFRPDAVGDALTNFLSAQSAADAYEHEKELAERKKKQRTTAVLGSALAGAATGGLAAAALAPAAVAGEAATIAAGGGMSTSLGGLTVGLSPTIAAGALSGASFGGRLGEQIANEDYAAAIQTGAVAGQAAIDYANNQRIYGFQPSREGRATLASLAGKAGTTIDVLEDNARRTGTTVAQQLGISQDQASELAIEEQRLGAAASIIGRAEAYDALDALNNDIDNFGPDYESVPDDDQFDQSQKARDRIESDLSAGAISREQASEKAQSVRQIVAKARSGRKQRHQPSAVEEFEANRIPGTNTAILRKPNGTGYQKFEVTSLNLPWEDPELSPEEQTAAKRRHREARTDVDEQGRTRILNDKGVWELEKGETSQERREKFLDSFVIESMKQNGVPPTTQEQADALEARFGVEQVIKDREQLSADIIALAKSGQVVTIEDAQKIADQAVALLGGSPPASVLNAVEAIDQRAKQAVVAVAAQQAMQQAATAPPPGSAASAESAGRATAKAIKGAPKAALKAVESAAPVLAETAGAPLKAGKAVGEFGVGLAEELLGIERSDTSPEAQRARLFAVVQSQNIQAGIDQPVGIIGPDGQVRQVIKGSLTPEKIAELKKAGFIIPGIE